MRHGLTAETVIDVLEDAEDYQAFEAAVIAGYDAETAVERELVLRLASVLWRLRRATGIETALFESVTAEPTNAARKDTGDCFLRLAALPTFPLDRLIPSLIDQNPCAHWRSPMDMMRQGWSTSLFHASQQ